MFIHPASDKVELIGPTSEALIHAVPLELRICPIEYDEAWLTNYNFPRQILKIPDSIPNDLYIQPGKSAKWRRRLMRAEDRGQ
jgi:hypothetical protein